MLRLTSYTAFVGVLFVGFYVFSPTLWAPADADLSGAPELLREYLEEQDRYQTLQQRLQVIQARLAAQTRICRELIDERLTLAEAARQFRDLPEAPNNYLELLRREYKEDTDEECLSRLVIRWACDELRDDPERAQQMRRRWEKELRLRAQELRRRGQAEPSLRATAR
jgi:hypothetical protein